MATENQQVAVKEDNSPAQFTPEKIDLIKRTIAEGATDTELQLFVEQCKRTGLDPITRQIYFAKSKSYTKQNGQVVPGKVSVLTSIDGFRLIAERSGKYEGQTKTEWCGTDGIWKDVWLNQQYPSAARVGVFKKGFIEPLYAVAIFAEYAQKNYQGEIQAMWAKMPALMIAKVAESLALRKAFPNDLSGLYTSDEMPEDFSQENQVTKSKELPPKTQTGTPPPAKEEPRKTTVSEVITPKETPPTFQAEDGDFAKFQGGGFAAPKTTAAPPSERNELSAKINAERVRLKWAPATLSKFVSENLNKKTIELTVDDMKLLLATLIRTTPKENDVP